MAIIWRRFAVIVVFVPVALLATVVAGIGAFIINMDEFWRYDMRPAIGRAWRGEKLR